MKTKIFKTLTLAFCVVAFSITTNAQFPEFTRIDTGAIHASSGHHISSGWFDMDNDGDMDVVITNTSGKGYTNHPNLLYKNERMGNFIQVKNTEYADRVLYVGLPGPFGDLDNDGDMDLIAANWIGPHNYFYRNDGYGNFEHYHNLFQLDASMRILFDLNNDSFLDLILFQENDTRVYYNDSDGNFSDYESLNITCTDPNAVIHNIAMGDADNDGDFDLYISYSTLLNGLSRAKNQCYMNLGSGVFEMISENALIVSDSAMCPNTNWMDYDNDGDMDLYVLNSYNMNPSESESGALYENKGEMVFEKHTIEPEEYRDCHRISSVWGDLDNDADLDLYITIEKNNFNNHSSPIKHNLLLLNDGTGQFNEFTDHLLAEESAHTSTFEDVDNDGDLDVLLVRYSWANNGRNTLCINEGNGNSWVILTCNGILSNKTAFGTRIIAKAQVNGESVSQIREITPMDGHVIYSSTRVHFGLGDAEIIDTLLIHWPSGQVDTYLNVATNQFYTAIEDDKLEVDFTATNYIQYAPTIPDQELLFADETVAIDLNDHYKFIKGDTVPVIEGDTMSFSIFSNEDTNVVMASINGNILTLESGSENGASKIQIIDSTSIAKRMDHFTVSRLVDVVNIPDKQDITAYPNPFNSSIVIEYELNNSETVEITIYNPLGKQIKTIEKKQSQGKQQVVWDAEGLPAGIYFCVLKTKSGMQTMKMIKLK